MASRSKCSYSPGELVYSGTPYVLVAGSGRCEYCCLPSLELKRCTNCQHARYCGKKCQREAWPDHKLECGILKNFPGTFDPELLRLISLVILKIKDKEWEDVYETVQNEKVSFADMLSCTSDDPRRVLYMKEMAATLEKYVGPKNVPGQEKLHQIIGKVKRNAIHSELKEGEFAFVALYLGMANIHYSCIPNCEHTISSRKIEVRAIKRIYKNEKFTMTKFDSIFTVRAVKVTDPTVVECKCDDCSKQYGKSVLTKILDDKAAYTVIGRTEDILMQAKLFKAIETVPGFEILVYSVLEMQKGVLADTNLLRMRLLSLKAFAMDGNPMGRIQAAQRLFDSAKEVFGEHHREVKRIKRLLTNFKGQMMFMPQGLSYIFDTVFDF